VKLLLSPAARKALAAMPAKDRSAMLGKLKNIASAPFDRQPGATALAGGGFRLRHAQWRAVYQLDATEDAMVVEAVGHRREIYR
jgi:mRNA-degrading endonuclease RelE of RelBE toxin-antitoxin system